MATLGGGMAVLPQYQGNYYDLQMQQALAQALMQKAVTPQQLPATVGSGGSQNYQVAPRLSPLAAIGGGVANGMLANALMSKTGQGYNDLGMQQWNALTGGNPAAGMGASGGSASPLQSAPAGQQSGVTDDTAGASWVSGGMSQQQPQGMLSPGGPMNPLGMPAQQAAMMYLNAPDKYWETQAAAYKPADIVSQLRAAGVDPSSPLGRQIAQGMLAKTIAPDYVSGRPGGYMLNKTTGQMEWLPSVVQGAMPVQDANGRFTGAVTAQPGAADVESNMAFARTAGEGGALPYSGVDVKGNPLPVTNRTAAATQGGVPGFTPFQNAVRQAESGGRPDAVNPASGAVGSMQTLPTTAANPGFGVRPAANNSPAELQRVGADYATAMQQKYGNDADAAVAYNWGPQNADKWIAAGRPWKMLPDETKAYVGQVMTQQQNYTGKTQGVTPSAGAIYASAPMGATSNANAAQQASAETMKNDYEGLQSARQNAPVVLQAYDHLIDLAKRAPSIANGGIGGMAASSQYAPFFSSDAAEYDKTRAFLISTLGKDLGKNNSDAARATISQMIPEYGKPLQAKLDGLQQARDQVAMKQLRGSFLTPAFQAGDSKTYTDLANQFDNNIKPAMLPVLQMSGPQQRSAVQAAINANPSLRPSFEWAFNNGMLK